jgi:hypothetical protein
MANLYASGLATESGLSCEAKQDRVGDARETHENYLVCVASLCLLIALARAVQNHHPGVDLHRLNAPTGVQEPWRPGAKASPGIVETKGQKALASYGQLPLVFETNHGRTDPQVKFLSRGRGYGLFLTSTDAVLTLTSERESKGKGALKNGNHNSLSGATFPRVLGRFRGRRGKSPQVVIVADLPPTQARTSQFYSEQRGSMDKRSEEPRFLRPWL